MAWTFSTSESTQEWMMENFLVSWSALQENRPWVLLTSVFSHNMLLHLFMNMFVLNSFGPVIERTLGSWRFLQFYLIAGLFSSFTHACVSNYFLQQPDIPALGASGAISGLVLLFSLVYPQQRILILGLIPVPALLGSLLFIGLDIWGLISQIHGGGLPIGHGAHLGGAFTGIIYYFLLRNSKRKNHDKTTTAL